MFPLHTAEGLCLHFWCSSCRLDKNHLIVFWLGMHTSRLSTLLFCKRIRLRSCRRLLSSCLKLHVHRNTCCFHKVCTMKKLLMKYLASKFQVGNLLDTMCRFRNRYQQDTVASQLGQMRSSCRQDSLRSRQTKRYPSKSFPQGSDNSCLKSFHLRTGCKCWLDKGLTDSFRCSLGSNSLSGKLWLLDGGLTQLGFQDSTCQQDN